MSGRETVDIESLKNLELPFDRIPMIPNYTTGSASNGED